MDEVDADSYYTAVRVTLLSALLLLAAHCVALFYLQKAIRKEEGGSGDWLPLHLCALAHGIAWTQCLLFLVHLSSAAADAGAIARSVPFQTAVLVCQYAATPFAYLYHEAIGYDWGASNTAGRALEAGMLLALLAVLLHGLLQVLSQLLPAFGVPLSRIALSHVANASLELEPPPPPQTLLLHAVLAHAGLIATLVYAARGSLHPLLLATWRPRRSSVDDATSLKAAQNTAFPPLQVRDSRSTAAAPEPQQCATGKTGEDLAAVGGSNTCFTTQWRRSGSAARGAAVDNVSTLLAQPLPSECSRSLSQFSPQLALRLFLGSLWVGMLVTVALQLLEFGWDHWCAALPVELDFALMSPLPFGDTMTRPLLEFAEEVTLASAGRRLLAVYFVGAAAYGHHALCRHQLSDVLQLRRPGGTPLQSLLLEAAVLQLLASAAPVAAHALGLIPSSIAASCTPLPLLPSRTHAAIYCAAFLSANCLGGAIAIYQSRMRVVAPPGTLLHLGLSER